MQGEANPYATPAAAVDDARVEAAAPALWNPTAAAAWSLLFTAACGAWLQRRNWLALGDARNARLSGAWCAGSLAMSAALLLLPRSTGLADHAFLARLLVLVAWYATHGRRQPLEVAKRYGGAYPRRAWGRALFVAVILALAWLALFVAIMLRSYAPYLRA